jgi:hypothetical protein
LARTRTAFGPLSHEAVFLTDARFVLHEGSPVKSDFCLASRQFVDGSSRRGITGFGIACASSERCITLHTVPVS